MGTFVAITDPSFMFIEHNTTMGKAVEAQTLARVGHKSTITCLILPPLLPLQPLWHCP